MVSALHQFAPGQPWPLDAIRQRQREIATMNDGRAPSQLVWEVVESLPVSEDIKRQTGNWKAHIATYRQNLTRLAQASIKTVCYNFMPILDWTRTDLAHRLPNCATCLRFDLVDFAAFDLFILDRKGAEGDYPAIIQSQAKKRFDKMSNDQRLTLSKNAVAGLPGAAEHRSLDQIRGLLASYDGISHERLRQNMIDFLEAVVPHAEALGVRLCCHPDDPPFDLLGLPRVMSTEEDYAQILSAVDSPANGMTFCTGSLGVRHDCDLPGIVARLGHKIHFVHLRNVTTDGAIVPCSFQEAEHLSGNTDMVAVIAALLEEERQRRADGRDDAVIPFRPDHGHNILDDLGRTSQPGYPAIGRLKGLAELRGIELALCHPHYGSTNLQP